MKVTIYGKPGCPNCVKAKNYCELNSIQYEYKTLGVDIDKELLESLVGGPVRTVPQIFINNGDGLMEHVGGLTNFMKHFKQM